MHKSSFETLKNISSYSPDKPALGQMEKQKDIKMDGHRAEVKMKPTRMNRTYQYQMLVYHSMH